MASQPQAQGRGHRWLVVPENINKASAIAFLRVFIGVFWILEVTVGHNWKLGGFGSGTNPTWIGPDAGAAVTEAVGSAIEDGTWLPLAWLYENVMLAQPELFSYLTVVLQVAFGVFFILGAFVRPMALLALIFDFSVFALGNSRIPPFFTAAHLFLLATNAGMYFGADGWLRTRVRAGREGALAWLIDLPFLSNRRFQGVALGVSSLMALFFFMDVMARPTTRFQNVSLDLAFLFGLVAAGLYFGRRAHDHIAVIAALLRIFIGFKFLHEIWVRTEPGVNGLPGFAGWTHQEETAELFENIAASHWPPFNWFIETLMLPALGLWLTLFAIVQLITGVALVLGWRTKTMGAIALVYLGFLMTLGFTRLAPFAFGLLVAVVALDAGRALGIESAKLSSRPARYGLPVPLPAIAILTVLALVNFVAAFVAVLGVGGVVPDSYGQFVGPWTALIVAIFSGLFALIGVLQRQSGGWAATADEPRDAVPHDNVHAQR